MAAESLPRWVWLAPAATGMGAVYAWWLGCESERGTWIGGVLVLLSGVLVLALAHESLPHRRGFRAWITAWAIAIVAGVATTGIVFFAAGIGYYRGCSPF